MATVARQQVIDMIEGLPSESLQELVRFIEFLRFRGGQEAKPPIDDAEAPLIAILRRHLPPEDQRRLSALRASKEDRPLTPEEQAELLAYVERIEREDAERAQALIELSRLRKVPLATLMNEFGLVLNA
jgi:DNA-binding TFAR19-related protein (PDSD5 family)